MGILEPRDPPTFLIDEDWRIGPARYTAQFGAKRAHLFGYLTVPGEKNEP
jgi:hypothetical protein